MKPAKSKIMKAFILIENGEVVANEQRKPEYVLYDHPSFPNIGVHNETEHHNNVKEWQDNNIRVENVHDNSVETIGKKYPCFAQLEGKWYWARCSLIDHWTEITPGTAIEIDNGIVTKIY